MAAIAPPAQAVQLPEVSAAAWVLRIPRGLVLALAATLIYGEAQRFD